MLNKVKDKISLKRIIFGLTLIIVLISSFSVFNQTKEEQAVILTLNDVENANKSIIYETCVNESKITDFNETNNSNYIIQMSFWECSEMKNTQTQAKTVQFTVEKYFRTIEKIANKNNFDSKKIGVVFDSNRFEVNVMYKNKIINTAILEKSLQTIKWEKEWQNINY
jgi:hypothetical protein